MRTRLMVSVGIAMVVIATGCTGQGEPQADAEAAEVESSEPFEADNCGAHVTVEEPPERIVTVKSSTTELVLALGAGDRLVAWAYPDGPPPDEYQAIVDELPVLSDRVPSNEAVLDMEPDLVYAGWESNLTTDGAGTRESFHDLDIATFIAPSACEDPEYQPNPLTFDDVFAEIEQVGELLGTPEEAAQLIEEQQERLDDISTSDGGFTALWYSSATDIPFVGAGIGAPQMVMEAVGLDNIAADVEDTWTSMSWEAVADADPDVIVLVDAEWNSADQKIDLLTSGSVTSQLTAVQEERYLIVPFATTEAGVRSVEAVEILAEQLEDATP